MEISIQKIEEILSGKQRNSNSGVFRFISLIKVGTWDSSTEGRWFKSHYSMRSGNLRFFFVSTNHSSLVLGGSHSWISICLWFLIQQCHGFAQLAMDREEPRQLAYISYSYFDLCRPWIFLLPRRLFAYLRLELFFQKFFLAKNFVNIGSSLVKDIWPLSGQCICSFKMT